MAQRLLFWAASLSLLTASLPAQAVFDNTYCVVESSKTDGTYHTLGRKVKGYNQGSSCLERILFKEGKSFQIKLNETVFFDLPEDVDSDNDSYSFSLDGSDADYVEIDGTELDEDSCALRFNVPHVQVKSLTVRVHKLAQAICSDLEADPVQYSQVTIIADDDLDQDKVSDESDNCPHIKNDTQIDQDNDGLGDVCDPCPNNPNNHPGVCQNLGLQLPDLPTPPPLPEPTPEPTAEPVVSPTPLPATPTPLPTEAPEEDVEVEVPPADANDVDADGTANDTDNCPAIANGGQEDTDSDGIGDACDPSPSVAGSTSEDSDFVEISSGASNGCSLVSQTSGLGSLGFLLFLLPVFWIRKRESK